MSSSTEKDLPIDLPSDRLTPTEKAQKNIYCISGLGADRRVFTKLIFKGYQPVHLNWLTPNKRESLADYAKRIAADIEENPILIGLSFGGIVATEIAKQIATEKVILISSAKEQAEIPWYFKMFRWFPIHLLIPFKSLLWAVYWLINWFFGLETVEERKLLKAILIDTDAVFLKWAIDRVVRWQNQTVPDNIYHIQGTSDRVFPLRFVEANVTVENGGHFMIMNRAERLSNVIDEVINRDEIHSQIANKTAEGGHPQAPPLKGGEGMTS